MARKFYNLLLSILIIFFSLVPTETNANHLGELSESSLNKLTAQDISQDAELIRNQGLADSLTADQLKGNLDKFDLSELNPVEASQAINAQYGTSHDFRNFPPGSKIENNKLVIGGSVVDLETFKGSHTVEFVNGKLYVNGNEYLGAQGVKSDGQSISVATISSLTSGQTQIVNGVNVKIFSDRIEAEYADTFIKGKTAASNVNSLKARTERFSVGSASKVVSGCNSFDNVKDSEFEVENDEIKVTTNSSVTLNITDCSYRDIEFESKGNGSSVTIKKDNYEISKGSLKCGSRDKIEADISANIEVGSDCFSCMTIIPAGTYFYSDADIRKDFSVNVPKEAPIYRLCLRKNQAQQMHAYNGLIDFVDRKIELNGIANYLRYPLKNNQISSLLSGFVYRGLKNVNALLSYDKDLLFLEKASIKNTVSSKNQITSTKPNNFYEIEEIELDGKVHRTVDLNLIAKEEMTEDMLSTYGSDSLDAEVRVVDGVLMQQAGESRVTVLPPGHKDIITFLG